MARKARPHERELRAAYLEYAENMEALAERATNGVLYSRKGQARADAGLLRQWDLFTRPWSQIESYLSEELRTWYAIHGRMTFTEYREQMREFNREAREAYFDSLAG